MSKEDIQEYFKLRMVEALHKDTLDSFRVRTNNVISILHELSKILEGWLEGNIKRFETVDFCIKEAKELIDKDECIVFSFLNKQLLKEELDSYIANSRQKKNEVDTAGTKQLLFLIDTIYSSNNLIYLKKCIEKIHELLSLEADIPDAEFVPTIDNINYYISSLCCEFLRLGYSKVYLYTYFKVFLENKKNIPFETAFSKMRENFLSNTEKDFTVIFKLEFQDKVAAQRATNKIKNIVEELSLDIQKSITRQLSYKISNAFIRYYVVNKKALDTGIVTRLAYEDLSNDFDFNLEDIANLKMPSTALVINDSFIRNEKVYYFDNKEDIVVTESQPLGETIYNIKQNTLSKDIQDRLYSALRHLRIGDQQTEIEQRFINYWIALEFIFASPRSSESTFERIKKYLPEILECCYVKRNILYINKWLRGKKVLEDQTSWDTLSDKDKEVIIGRVDILTKYRLLKLKARMCHKDKTKEYIKNHRNNLEYHITRIYRLRNELIHEAAIKQDMVNVTSNLRFYLVFTLNQLIVFLIEREDSTRELDISHFLGKFNILSKYLKKECTINNFMSMVSIDKFII
ncbi:hypothetical protein [Prevotella denticola]|uniref:hypothetical protein n=1 Tax=Prevotella denticola TaxID=28129 RepID=UPI001BA8F672|nr:hypothetical protein [Prevotella denticola]QUB91044.1 hypothetical protein J4855_00745 [Prevotella denticola]